ncbi:hypothetical protein ACFLSP_03345, partial [Bacteroidota bacterium]
MQYRSLLLVLVIIFLSPPARSQEITDFFGDVVLRIDTSEYSMLGNQVSYLDQQHLAFRFSEADPVCEVTL